MNLTPSLESYRIEREDQLARLLAVLRKDKRVRAAWASGSLGRGDADPLSDIDLIVVVRDDRLQEVIANRYAFAEQIGRLLFTLDAPQNAPAGGGYLAVCTDAPTAPHLIDLYWQGESHAWDASRARRLFARPGVAAGDRVMADQVVCPGAVGPSWSGAPVRRADAGAPQPISDRKSRGDELPHEVRYFWMMLLITAKYAWRQPCAREMSLLPLLTGAYAAAHALAGKNAAPVPQPGTVGEPAQKLALLRTLAEGMAGLMAALPGGFGKAVENLLPAVGRYLAMVENII